MNTSLLAGIFAVAVALIVWLLVLLWQSRKPAQKPLPKEWALAPRSVFSSEERRVYRVLREALPRHVILSKLPLVRFCQPTNSQEVRYWFDLLGASHVTFAVCSANGRVLAAIDLEPEQRAGYAERALKIKKSVLEVCHVQYMSCKSEHLPSVAELQALVPQSGTTAKMPAHTIDAAKDQLAHTVAHRRAQRTALWQDSASFQDSFFAMDSRFDGAVANDFLPLPSVQSGAVVAQDNGDAAKASPSAS